MIDIQSKLQLTTLTSSYVVSITTSKSAIVGPSGQARVDIDAAGSNDVK